MNAEDVRAFDALAKHEVVITPTMCAKCGHWSDWHHLQKDGTYPCIGRCGCLDHQEEADDD